MRHSATTENSSCNWSSTLDCPSIASGVQFVQIDLTVALVFSIYDVIGILLGSLANIVMIGLVLNQSGLRTTDFFTSSLCVSDLLASVLFQPFVIRRLLARRPNEPYEWHVRRVIGQTTLSASSMSLLTATIDRYIELRWPLRHQNIIQTSTALMMISGIWLASFTMGVTAYFNRDLSAVVFPSILAVIVVSVVLIQSAIFIIAKNQVKKIWFTGRGSVQCGKNLLCSMRATKTIALLLAVFLISWLPSTLFRFYDRLSDGDIITFDRWLHPLNTLIQIHCSLDPYLYVLRNHRFKKVLMKVFKRERIAACPNLTKHKGLDHDRQ